MLPLAECDSQIGSHLLFFLANNWGHQPILPYFCLIVGIEGEQRKKRDEKDDEDCEARGGVFAF